MSVDVSAALDKLKQGERIGYQEIAEVKRKLVNPGPADSVGALVRILALAEEATKQNVALVERYFNNESDDCTLRDVIYALCHYWHGTRPHTDKLLEFASFGKWPYNSETVIASFSALGEYLEETHDARIYGVILKIVEEQLHRPHRLDEEEYLLIAYKSLWRGLMGPRRTLKAEFAIQSRDDIESELLEAARERSGTERSGAKRGRSSNGTDY